MTKDELAAIEARADSGNLLDAVANYRDLKDLVAEVRRLQMELVAMNEEYYRATCDDK